MKAPTPTTPDPAAPPRVRLRHAVLTLLAGGALAQALPLLLGPWLTRLYTPGEFGVFHLFAAVAANVAVVACARYEFALPLARDAGEAAALRALCARLLAAATALSALGGAAWALALGAVWPLWLPVTVAALGAVSVATLQATRDERFRPLALARVVQHGGGALLQGVAGVLHAGVAGLIAAPAAAAVAATALLGWGRASPAQAAAPRPPLAEVARRHRDFPLLNTPHAFLGALLDTVSLALVAAALGAAAAGFWGLTLRYLKAPATLVGGAVSQALYPRLVAGAGDGLASVDGRRAVVRVMAVLGALALPGVALLLLAGPALFQALFGPDWRPAGELARALAPYIGVHFVASPLAVATMAWGAQRWALTRAMAGQALFVAGLAAGLATGDLVAAGWAVSAASVLYFGWYFHRLATWPLADSSRPPAAAPQEAGSP